MLALRNKVKEEKHLRDIRRVEGRYWNENEFARPNGLREKAENCDFVEETWTYKKKKKRYVEQHSGGGGRGYKDVPVWHNNKE